MSAILYCHIQLFIDDLRWHRASGRRRYWRLKLRIWVRLRAKYTERKDNYIFGRTSPHILLCVCVYSSLSQCVHLVTFRYLIFLISHYDDLARRQDDCYMLNGKGFGTSRDLLEVVSWTTREGWSWAVTKIIHDIRCPIYRYYYLLGDITVLVSLLMRDALHDWLKVMQ
jgi:hypothetical protein